MFSGNVHKKRVFSISSLICMHGPSVRANTYSWALVWISTIGRGPAYGAEGINTGREIIIEQGLV